MPAPVLVKPKAPEMTPLRVAAPVPATSKLPLAVVVVRTVGVLSVRLPPVATKIRSDALPPLATCDATVLVPPPGLSVSGPVPEIVRAVGLRSLTEPAVRRRRW